MVDGADGDGARNELERGGRRVLLVEDDHDSAEMISLFLDSEGYVVLWVDTGAAAIAAVTAALLHENGAFEPDLILLDLTLPDIEGSTVVQRLRTLGLGPLPPIIAASARPLNAILATAHQIGAAGIARKPFSLFDLLKTIENLLGEAPVPLPAAAPP